jgi:hypothetical protein
LEPRLLLSATPTEVTTLQEGAVLEPAAVTVPNLPSLDIDLNGQADALSDGIVLLRHMFGFTGTALTDGAVDPAGQRNTAAAITAYLTSLPVSTFDVDLNNQVDALSDGILILRNLFGFSGTALTDGVTDPAGRRTNPAAITAYLNNMNPAAETAAPAVAMELTQDTGTSATDRLSQTVAVSGAIADLNTITTFKAGVDATPLANFIDVSADLLNGLFAFSEARLAQLAGLGTLADGTHTLHLLAGDSRGNNSQTDLTFTRDTAGPTVIGAPAGTFNTAVGFFDVGFAEAVSDTALAAARYSVVVLGGPNDGNAVAINRVDRLSPQSVRVQLNASLADETYRLTVQPGTTDLAGNAMGAEFLSTFTVQDAVRITQVSPVNGEEMVGPERETVVRFSGAIDPATVTTDSLYLIANGTRVPGRVTVSSTELFATFFQTNPLPSATEVRIVVDGSLIKGRDGLFIDADGNGTPGGIRNTDFRVQPLTRIQGTNIFGFVYDSQKNPDGSNRPIVGATIRVDAFPAANVVTDVNGRFELINMPAPEFFVHIDGGTATSAPAGFFYPEVGKLIESVPGQTVQLNLDGVVFDVFLPAMAAADLQTLSTTQTTEVGFGQTGLAELAAMFPNIAPEVWERLQVGLAPGSAVDQFGNAATQAVIIPVAPDRIPGPLPPMVNPQLVISIQTLGATNFDVPATISFPNLEGLAPGEQSLIMSFDHDLGIWRVVATGTVSADGLTIVSDPGQGIQAPGWHIVDPWTNPRRDAPGPPPPPPPPPPATATATATAYNLDRAAATAATAPTAAATAAPAAGYWRRRRGDRRSRRDLHPDDCVESKYPAPDDGDSGSLDFRPPGLFLCQRQRIVQSDVCEQCRADQPESGPASSDERRGYAVGDRHYGRQQFDFEFILDGTDFPADPIAAGAEPYGQRHGRRFHSLRAVLYAGHSVRRRRRYQRVQVRRAAELAAR